jgi:hypothetical protein
MMSQMPEARQPFSMDMNLISKICEAIKEGLIQTREQIGPSAGADINWAQVSERCGVDANTARRLWKCAAYGHNPTGSVPEGDQSDEVQIA